MRKHLNPNRASHMRLLDKMPKVYCVACWARYGIMELHYAGRFVWVKEFGDFFPLIYQYDDHNGVFEEYALRPLCYCTTGRIVGFFFNKERAQYVASVYNGLADR